MTRQSVTHEPRACPSPLALQRFALCREESDVGAAEHVATCLGCQRFVADLQAEGASYMSSLAAESLRVRLADLEAAGVPTSAARGPRYWAWGGALAAAASVVLVLSSAGHLERSSPLVTPAPEALTPKGMPQLSLWIGEAGRAQSELSDAAVLRPGERVQPVFSASDAGFVAIVISSPKGERVQLYPRDQEQGAPVQAAPPGPLGPSFRLDEEAGSYRVTAYFAKASFSTQVLTAPGPPRGTPTFPGLILTRQFEVRP